MWTFDGFSSLPTAADRALATAAAVVAAAASANNSIVSSLVNGIDVVSSDASLVNNDVQFSYAYYGT
jgi:predicted Rossmann fold nucleotide-binding protein DprA/Smf involved in DNA uptake